MKRFFMALGLLGCVSTAQALEVGDQAPCVVLNQISAQNTEAEHCIRDHGPAQAYTLIEFFSVTCGACMENHPILNQVANDISATTLSRQVAVDRDEKAIRNYVSANRKDFPLEVALDFDRDAKKAYGVVETPTTFILDANQKVIYKHAGVFSPSDVAQIKELVK